MYRFLTLFFLISCSTLLTSCATKTVEGFEKAERAKDVYTASYFSNSATDYVYKAKISAYGRDFGGIFIAKKINDTSHRVAFTTEFGNKLFDFEVSESGVKINYILEELDRKMIVNTLKQDFTLLLKENHRVTEIYQNEQFEVYKSEDGQKFNYLFTEKASGSLIKMVHATKAREKIIFNYTPATKELAQNIIIDHKSIKLRIELNYISQK